MVNGNYVLYGDRPSSESEIVCDHVHTRTVERKAKRKSNRTANELQRSLNLAQLDNATDSDKFEKKIKEPRLLRYVPTTEIEEHYVTEKFETYDLKPIDEAPKRYTFAKKPKNPSDGSVNYAYSRSSSSCSSPNGNLPTISEHGEQYGTYKIRGIQTPPISNGLGYESKFDKYFTTPRDVKSFAAKGTHPDSLYRVPSTSGSNRNKVFQIVRNLRWPVALFGVCVALAIFVYFLMPDNLGQASDSVNGTFWDESITSAQTYSSSTPHSAQKKSQKNTRNSSEKSTGSGMKTAEIDFYDTDDKTLDLTSVIAETSATRNLPVLPIFPAHIEPEIQYGNENADIDKIGKPKILEENNTIQDESTLKPHITQKPEKPLAVYFTDNEAITTTTVETIEPIKKSETSNTIRDEHKITSTTIPPTQQYLAIEENVPNYRVHITNANIQPTYTSTKTPHRYRELYQPIVNPDVQFTSGHSKLFGISIEDSHKIKSTTQSSLYNTRVSPTLPTWKDKDDTTTKKYPVNISDVPQCRSTRLPICRGILPYDLAGAPVFIGKTPVTQFLPQIEYLVSTNCSERVRHFACALLEPECSPPPYSSKLPCYNLCKAIVDNCDGYIPQELSQMFTCNQYSSSNCASSRAPCFTREMPCGDGSCVPRDWICDGTRDCPGGEDEAPCLICEDHEFACSTGLCIVKRWLCDGYSDCPQGEDESDAICRTRYGGSTAAALGEEPGEELAGSAPAPSIHKLNRVQGQKSRNFERTESDSSSELLMTSDSSNSFKRNFTRRPSSSRLSPYSRPMLKTKQTTEAPTTEYVTERRRPAYFRKDLKHDKNKNNNETPRDSHKVTEEKQPSYKATERTKSSEEFNVGDLALFDDIAKETTKKYEMLSTESTPIASPTKFDKSSDNVDRVINGAELLRKAAIARKQDLADSPESNSTFDYEMTGGGHNSAHASPCPSGELRCVDGRCITLAQLCDGTIDCTDHADEDNCYT